MMLFGFGAAFGSLLIMFILFSVENYNEACRFYCHGTFEIIRGLFLFNLFFRAHH